MKTKKYILFLTIVLISLTVVMPFNVIKAEDATYKVCDECLISEPYTNGNQSIVIMANSQYDSRIVSIRTNSTTIYTYLVSLVSNKGYFGNVVNSESNINGICNLTALGIRNFTSATYSGNTFYYYEFGSFPEDYSNRLEIPVVNYSDYSVNGRANLAYELTYGSLAVDPSTAPTYGLLKTGYSTKFVTTNFEGLNDRNIDTITWEDNDTNGNFIGSIGYQVEIRAIPGYYEASTQAALIAQNVQNFFRGLLVNASGGSIDLEPVQYYTLVKTSANRKEFSITWEEVIDHFPQNWGRYYKQGSLLRNLQNEELWYKTGWLYEIRYLYNEGEEDEYISDWQTIYQVTSVDPGTSTNIIQTAPQGLTPELYNLLQTVNTLNNTVQNWNINGVPINMEPQNTPTSDGSWLEYIVNAISTMVGSIVDAIAEIVKAILGIGSDIIEGIFNLITSVGVNVVDFFSNIWNGLMDLLDDIDLSLFEWSPDPESTESYNFVQPIIDGFSDAGLLYMLMIPMIVLVVRVFI